MRLGKHNLAGGGAGLAVGADVRTSAQAAGAGRETRAGMARRPRPLEHRAFVRHEEWRFDGAAAGRFEHRPGFGRRYYVGGTGGPW